MKAIGFIGIGTMGRGMVSNLLKNDFQVIGFTRTKSKIEISDKNFYMAHSSNEVSKKSDIVITCLPSDDAINQLIFSSKGFLDSMKNKILVDCGTTSVETTQKIADACKKLGVDFLDAPMTGSKIAAESGKILFMVGGSQKILESCNEIFMAMGYKIIRCGENTSGQRAKIALNITQAMVLESYIEGIAIGLKNNLPLTSLLEIFENSGAKNNASTVKMPKIIKRDFEPHFKLELMNKDVGFAANEMKKLKLNLPLASQMQKIYKEAMKNGWGEEDFSCVAKLIEEKSGVEFKE